MKTYEKPHLMALSLSSNDSLCACAIDAVGSNADPTLIYALDEDWNHEKMRPEEYVFGVGEPVANSCMMEVAGYCKFGPSGEEFTVFNS